MAASVKQRIAFGAQAGQNVRWIGSGGAATAAGGACREVRKRWSLARSAGGCAAGGRRQKGFSSSYKADRLKLIVILPLPLLAPEVTARDHTLNHLR